MSAASFQPRPRRFSLLATVAAHGALLWLLWSWVILPLQANVAAPLSVALLVTEVSTPAPAALPPLRQPHTSEPPPRLPPAPLPPVQVWPTPTAAPPTTSVPNAVVADVRPPAARTEAVAEASTDIRPEPLPAPPPAPKPRLLRADQVRYIVMPPAQLPLLSRRAGESGTVWLRVRIDVQGRPVRIGLHRSSGFARLDEQALAAMAEARFAPRLEDGVAVEVEVIAPIEYVAD